MNQYKEYPRVLVVSNNPFSDTQNNGKTLSAFFNGWPKDKIAQLYITPEEPDKTVCEQFYRVTDYEILACFLRGAKKAGSEYFLNKEKNNTEGEKELGTFVTHLYKNRGNHDGGKGLHYLIHSLFIKRLPLALIIRDVLWNRDYWKTEEFVTWLNKFSPEVVFFQSGDSVSTFKKIEWITHTMDIPLIMEVTDDYVSPKLTIDIFGWVHYFWLKKWFAETVKKAYRVITIGDLMAEEYERRFGGQYDVLMNSVSVKKMENSYAKRNTEMVKIVYAGGLHLNRWKTISIIGECLQELKTEGYRTKFSIFSNTEPGDKIKAAITIPPVMSYDGSLNQDELKETLNDSDILVHVEAFDRKNRTITRLSISTKIPEYMAAGRCIFAVGPKEVASIQYLQQNNIAEVCTSLDKRNLKEKLRGIIIDTDKRIAIGKYAQQIAVERHNSEQTQITIKEHIINATNEKK